MHEELIAEKFKSNLSLRQQSQIYVVAGMHVYLLRDLITGVGDNAVTRETDKKINIK